MRLFVAVVVSGLSLAVCFAAAPPAKVPAEWLKLIDQLGEEEADRRTAAEKALTALGEDVLPPLRRAAKGHADADVRLRAVLVVAAIEKEEYREVRRFVGHTNGVHCLALSPDGKQLFSGSWYGNRQPNAFVWDVASGKEVRRLKEHDFGIHAADWSSDGKLLATSGPGRVLSLWDTGDGTLLSRTKVGPNVTRIRFLPGNERVVCSYSNDVCVFEVRTTKQVRALKLPAAKQKGEMVAGLAVLPGGKRALTGGSDGVVRLFDLGTGEEVRQFTGHDGQVNDLAASPDGRHFLSAGDDRTVRLWDVEKGKEVRRFTGHAGRVLSVAWSADGGRLVSTSDDKTARVWDAQSGETLHRFEGHTAAVSCAVFLPGGRHVATGGHDNTLRVWKVRP
jgi:WD40 repeat protein